MTDKQEKKMIKAANKHWFDESGGYDKKDIMVDSFVKGYRKAFALYSVSQHLKLIAFAKYMEEDKMYERHDEANVDDFLDNNSN